MLEEEVKVSHSKMEVVHVTVMVAGATIWQASAYMLMMDFVNMVYVISYWCGQEMCNVWVWEVYG